VSVNYFLVASISLSPSTLSNNQICVVLLTGVLFVVKSALSVYTTSEAWVCMSVVIILVVSTDLSSRLASPASDICVGVSKHDGAAVSAAFSSIKAS